MRFHVPDTDVGNALIDLFAGPIGMMMETKGTKYISPLTFAAQLLAFINFSAESLGKMETKGTNNISPLMYFRRTTTSRLGSRRKCYVEDLFPGTSETATQWFIVCLRGGTAASRNDWRLLLVALSCLTAHHN